MRLLNNNNNGGNNNNNIVYFAKTPRDTFCCMIRLCNVSTQHTEQYGSRMESEKGCVHVTHGYHQVNMSIV